MAKKVKAPENIDFKKRAKAVFENHNVEQVHFTSDGTGFLQEQHARIHAGNLGDEIVTTIKKEEV